MSPSARTSLLLVLGAIALAGCTSAQDKQAQWSTSASVSSATKTLSSSLEGASGVETCAPITTAADRLDEVDPAPDDATEAARARAVKDARAAVGACARINGGDEKDLVAAAQALTRAKESLGALAATSKKAGSAPAKTSESSATKK